MYCLRSLLFLFYTLNLTWGWGDVGHRTVAYLAEKYLTKQATQLVEDLIPLNETFDISDAAVWPDTIKFKRPFTRNWHFIDAVDQPPNSCAVSYEADCNDGCVISAIDNMTHQVQDLDLDNTQQGEALMFLIHFIGDLHQPLHVEEKCKGGNEIHVHFDHHGDKKENLHSVWDTDIPHKINGIKHRLKHNEEKEPAIKWAEKLFLSQGLRPLHAECADTQKPLKCSMLWAAETNRLNCDFVFKKGIEWLETEDLGGEYYEGAAPIVETQILKAGIRVAVWLNALAADRPSPASGGLCTHQGGKVKAQKEL